MVMDGPGRRRILNSYRGFPTPLRLTGPCRAPCELAVGHRAFDYTGKRLMPGSGESRMGTRGLPPQPR